MWKVFKIGLFAALTVTMLWHWQVAEAEAHCWEKSSGIPWAVVPGDTPATSSGAEEALQADPVPDGHWKDLGTFRTTGYCNCRKCCGKWAGGKTASGVYPVAGETIAVDPAVIPLGSMVMVDGHIYWAQDTGSGIKGKRIDVYYDDHSVAWNHGVKKQRVFVWRRD